MRLATALDEAATVLNGNETDVCLANVSERVVREYVYDHVQLLDAPRDCVPQEGIEKSNRKSQPTYETH